MTPETRTPQGSSIVLIAACCGWGSGHDAAELGPKQLIKAGIAELLHAQVVVIEPLESMFSTTLSPEAKEASIMDIANRVSDAVVAAIEDGKFPVILGGDHTSALGFHSGLARVHGQTGVIWIDAHTDLNTPETSPSGNIHGMVLGGLLGRGSKAMVETTGASQIIDEHVAMVGIRSIDEGEQYWLDEGKINCMAMTEVTERGLGECLAKAVQTANQAQTGFGLTIDLDAIDPSQTPFVATPVENGIDANELVALLATMPCKDRILGMEVTEFTPKSDEDAEPASRIIANLIAAVTGDFS